MKDPFVDEVRRARMVHTTKFHSDLHLICKDLREFESALGSRVVTLEPRRIQSAIGGMVCREPRRHERPRTD